ncbi:MAG: site-2 protease family protein [Gemmataceae bacterium]
MRDPLHWSLPIGRVFGVHLRIHAMLPLVFFGLLLREVTRKEAPPDVGVAVLTFMGLFFLSLLLHEFGHVLVARLLGGDCDRVILWPLGGLTNCDLPHSARSQLMASLAGPAVNLLICALTASTLAGHSIWPPLNPFSDASPYKPVLVSWTGEEAIQSWYLVMAARLFWINWVLLLFNLIPAYPLDGANTLHSVLWSRGDYRDALATTAYVGFAAMLGFVVLAIFRENVLLFGLVVIIYLSCRSQFVQGEAGTDDSMLGYDFSQGYSSLDRSAAAPPRRQQPNFLQRWFQRRAARKALQEQHDREAEEERMDKLLEKVQEHGLMALTEEERRFLNRVSARYRGK